MASSSALLRYLHPLLLLALGCATAPSAIATPEHPAAALVRQSEAAMRTDPDASRDAAEQALGVLKKHPDPDLEVLALLQLCDYYTERSQEMAQAFLEQAKTLLPRVQRKGLQASVVNYQGEIYETAGDNAHALEQYEQAVQLAGAAHDDEMLGKALYSRGYLAGLQGRYAAGLNDLQQAQGLFDKHGMRIYSTNVMNSLALLYDRVGDYQQAIRIYDLTLASQRELQLVREQGLTLHNRGRAHENMNNWSRARMDFAAAQNIFAGLHYERGQAYALRGLAAADNAQGHPEQALAKLAEASHLQAMTPDARLDAQIQLERGRALHQAHDYEKSTIALEKARTILTKANSLNELSQVYAELASVYADMNNWNKAYANRSAGMELATQLLRNQLDQRYSALKLQFDTATRDRENELLTRENAANQLALLQAQRAHRWQLVVIILTGILLAVVAGVAWHQRRGKYRMQTLAMTDELTQMPNRRAVLGRLDALLRSNQPGCAIMIVDIDHFKHINDKHGHLTGDAILKAFSRHLRYAIHEPCFLGRLGGEEFIVALPDHALAQAYGIAEQLRLSIANLDLSTWCADKHITISTGITVSMTDDTPSAMLQRADRALYAAKFEGRNCTRSEPEFASAIHAANVTLITSRAVS